jgi:hypothetical protein
MATPIIQSTGSVSGAGTAGQGRKDLDIGETVTLSDTEPLNSGASYVWLMEDRPIGSATVLNNPNTATPTFVPDVTGSYRVRATVNGTSFSVEVFAVPLPNTGARIPSFEEELQYDGGGNTKGWHEALTEFMRDTDSLLTGSTDENVKVTTNDTTTGKLASKIAAGTNITLTTLNPGGNEQLQISASSGVGVVLTRVAVVTSGPFAAAVSTLVPVDPTSGPITINLPAISGGNQNLWIVIKNRKNLSTAITVVPDGSNTIDEAANYLMLVPYESITLVSDGTSNWDLI